MNKSSNEDLVDNEDNSLSSSLDSVEKNSVSNNNSISAADSKTSQNESENIEVNSDESPNENEDSNNQDDENYKKNKKDEQYRLGGRSPLSTLCHLIIGPLLSQISQSLYGIMDSFWISRSIGTKGMTVMSIILVIDFINIAFAQYFNVAVSARISYLFGKHMKEECSQVIIDFFRICIIVGILLPVILLPCVHPLMRWYGGDDEIVPMCMDYLLPALCCSMLNYTYLSLCGLLQAMGNSGIYGICQVSSAVLNMACFDPLFLVGIKSGMWGASLATALSNFIPMLVLYILLFKGKFVVKPKFNMYLKKFSPHSWKALRVSLSQLIANLASALPILILSKLIAQSATNAGNYVDVMAVWNVNDRLYAFAICICNGLNQGFLPAASYAFGCERLNRLLRMFLITVLIGTIWTTFVCILIESIPKQIAQIWGNDEGYLKVAPKMLRISFMSCFANQIILTTAATLQAMKMVILSIVTSILTMLIPIPVFGFILYYTKKNDPVRMMYSFIGHDLWAVFVSIIVIVWKLRFLWKAPKDSELNLNNQEDHLDKSYAASNNEDTENEEVY
ncbi:hypothetical protein M9Y10_010558 [Tritrichomonas musculus]|uniref:MatE family protein n=1 Tax=Tritrichomonas musculus TaxID=1915356 RepID=A0ABR2IMM6_9EUKA